MQANSEDIIDTKAESAYALLRQSLSLYSEDTIDTQANSEDIIDTKAESAYVLLKHN